MRPIALITLLLVVAQPALADFGSAMSAYERRDYTFAAREFRLLADQGEAKAQFMLGRMYALGDGVLQDYVQAHKWFNLAASAGQREAGPAREEVARKMTPAQVAEAQRLARAWQAPAGVAGAAPGDVGPAPRDTVAGIQRLLARLGYDPGPADGLMGGKTRGAIRQYQVFSGLAVDGRPSQSLYRRLSAEYEGHAAPEAPPAGAPPVAAAPAWSAGASRSGPREEFVRRLNDLITRAERRRSADSRFLDSLRGLTQTQPPVTVAKVLEDDFRDGDYSADPAWRVVSGQFRVDREQGLVSRVEPAGAQRASGNQERAVQLLGALLGGGGGGALTPAAAAPAEIYLSRRIDNAFELELQLASAQPDGHLEFGVFQGAGRRSGYRIVYRPGADLELMRVSASGPRVLGRHAGPLDLEDGGRHRLEWSRDGAGRMRVRIDGRTLVQATDRGFKDPFDGFVFENRGGDYRLRSFRLIGAAAD